MALRIINFTDPWAARHLQICVRNFRALPAHAQWLVEHLTARSQSQPRHSQ
jgi:hypothetical protein